ncbi:MAG: hypothetical protein K6G63_00580 [Eubacterium sp.]|nr:hypothetical protein [Eubacterium sp.]
MGKNDMTQPGKYSLKYGFSQMSMWEKISYFLRLILPILILTSVFMGIYGVIPSKVSNIISLVLLFVTLILFGINLLKSKFLFAVVYFGASVFVLIILAMICFFR